MKRLLTAVLFVLLLVGCSSDKVLVTTSHGYGITDIQALTMIVNAIEEYDGQSDIKYGDITAEATDEVVDGIKKDLISINFDYTWNGKAHKARMLIHALPAEKYKAVRYQNYTTGTFLK